ncbi:MAG: YbaK/EbsC family protein, partial [Candidatus Parvarchaeota archaeon]|nr:YbaK/EbsC family protein [Candidatus Parvarchaeota archaeon]
SFIVQKTGFEAGGVAPVVKENMQIFIDKGVMKHEFVWISAGSRTAVIKLDTKGLDKALNAEIISISC